MVRPTPGVNDCQRVNGPGDSYYHPHRDDNTQTNENRWKSIQSPATVLASFVTAVAKNKKL